MRLEGPGPLTLEAIKHGTETGRGGKGNIYVWAGGNGRVNSDNSNYDGYANLRQTLAIGASTDQGLQAGYSEPGANLLVNAPSNGGQSQISPATPPAITRLLLAERPRRRPWLPAS
jgi:kexin